MHQKPKIIQLKTKIPGGRSWLLTEKQLSSIKSGSLSKMLISGVDLFDWNWLNDYDKKMIRQLEV